MFLTGHQPNYLPYPGFFQKIAATDAFLVVDTTQFVKRGPFGWIHRNRIATPNGPIWLSLPVLHKGKYEQRICDTRLDPNVNWQRKHWKSIEWNYGKSPGWDLHSQGLRQIYEQPWSKLADVNIGIIRWFLDELELHTQLFVASELRAQGKSTQYIVAFCKELGADAYLSGMHGRDYLEVPRFEEAGIKLVFQQYEPPRYDGFGGKPAEAGLSMLDMLFWSGDHAKEWVHGTRELPSR